ncbi:MAG: ribonuclease III domain-containing protein [Clostridia bacterium]
MQFFQTTSNENATLLNPLVLAFVGDAVQTLFIRAKLATSTDYKAGELHRQTAMQVKSHTQAESAERLLPILSKEELAVYTRARNAKCNTIAKNSSIADYKKASGLEAVFGYLYLTSQSARLEELLNLAVIIPSQV